MNKTNIEEIADKLRIAWNSAMGISNFLEWEDTDERSRRGYIAVAKAAVECAGEKQYRMLEVGEVLQDTDEFNYSAGGWAASHEAGHKVSDLNVGEYRRPVANCTVKISELEQQTKIEDQAKQIRDLETKLEIERNRLAACGVVALADTPESAAEARKMLPEYHSASCGDVERRVDECMELRRKVQKLEADNEAIHEEMRKTQADWDGVYSWIHSNVSGCMGRRCSEVTLELLRGSISANNHATFNLQGALYSAQQNLARIEKATMRLRGFRAINSPDPAQCIEDASALIQKLTFQNHKLTEEPNDYRKAWTIASRTVSELTERCEQLQAVIADKTATIRRLREKLGNLEPVVDDWNKDHMEMKRKFDLAESYIEELEQDLSFYLGIVDQLKNREEMQ